jgi:hypothetical protein
LTRFSIFSWFGFGRFPTKIITFKALNKLNAHYI